MKNTDWMDDLWGEIPAEEMPKHYEGRVTEFGGVEHWNGYDWVIFHNEQTSGAEMDLLNPESWTPR